MIRSLKNIAKKITSSNEILSEIALINDEIEYFEKKIRNQKPSCLIEDEKYNNKLSNLYSIKSYINKRYKQYIRSKLNKFPLNKACSSEFITDKINITNDEFDMVMFINQDQEFVRYTPIKKNDKSYYHSGIYDNGTTIILNENKDSSFNTLFYLKILFGWKVIRFNKNYYYERIK